MLEADIYKIKKIYAIMWQQWEENHGQKITIFFLEKDKNKKIEQLYMCTKHTYYSHKHFPSHILLWELSC